MDGRQISAKLRNNLLKHSNMSPEVHQLAYFLKSFSKYFTEKNVHGR